MTDWLPIDEFTARHGVTRRTVYRWTRSRRVAVRGPRRARQYRLVDVSDDRPDEPDPGPDDLRQRVRKLELELARVHELVAHLIAPRNPRMSDTQSDTMSDTTRPARDVGDIGRIMPAPPLVSDTRSDTMSDIPKGDRKNRRLGAMSDTRSDTMSDTISSRDYSDVIGENEGHDPPMSDTRNDTMSDTMSLRRSSHVTYGNEEPVSIEQRGHVTYADDGLPRATPAPRTRANGGRFPFSNKKEREEEAETKKYTSASDGEVTSAASWADGPDGESPLLYIVGRWNDWADGEVGRSIGAKPHRLDRLLGSVTSLIGSMLRQYPHRSTWVEAFDDLDILSEKAAEALRLLTVNMLARPIRAPGEVADDTPRLFRLREYSSWGKPKKRRKRQRKGQQAFGFEDYPYHGKPGESVAPLPFKEEQIRSAPSAPDGGTIWDPTRPPQGDGSAEYCWVCHARRWLDFEQSRHFWYTIYLPLRDAHPKSERIDVDVDSTGAATLHPKLIAACDAAFGAVPTAYTVPLTARG